MEKRFSIKSLLLGILMATAVPLSMPSSHAEQPSYVAEWHQPATPASNQLIANSGPGVLSAADSQSPTTLPAVTPLSLIEQHDRNSEKPAEGKVVKKKRTFFGKILNFIGADLFSGDYPDGYTSFTSG